jgi:hypothetical protein
MRFGGLVVEETLAFAGMATIDSARRALLEDRIVTRPILEI